MGGVGSALATCGASMRAAGTLRHMPCTVQLPTTLPDLFTYGARGKLGGGRCTSKICILLEAAAHVLGAAGGSVATSGLQLAAHLQGAGDALHRGGMQRRHILSTRVIAV